MKFTLLPLLAVMFEVGQPINPLMTSKENFREMSKGILSSEDKVKLDDIFDKFVAMNTRMNGNRVVLMQANNELTEYFSQVKCYYLYNIYTFIAFSRLVKYSSTFSTMFWMKSTKKLNLRE